MVKPATKEESGWGSTTVNLETEAERIYQGVLSAFMSLEYRLKENGINLEFTRFEFQPTHRRDNNFPSIIRYDLTLEGKTI